MGECIDGLAKLGGLHAGDAYDFQEQGGCDQFRAETRLRVFRAGAEYAEVYPQGVCDAVCSQFREAEAGEDEIGGRDGCVKTYKRIAGGQSRLCTSHTT